MVQLYQNYNIELGNSTSYYPQGNGLAKSSNKSLIENHQEYVVTKQKGMGFSLKICNLGR
jgi:hypothetical protein